MPPTKFKKKKSFYPPIVLHVPPISSSQYTSLGSCLNFPLTSSLLGPKSSQHPILENPQPTFFTAVTRFSLFHSHIAHICTDSASNSNVILTLVTLDPSYQGADCHHNDTSCNPTVNTSLLKYLHLVY